MEIFALAGLVVWQVVSNVTVWSVDNQALQAANIELANTTDTSLLSLTVQATQYAIWNPTVRIFT